MEYMLLSLNTSTKPQTLSCNLPYYRDPAMGQTSGGPGPQNGTRRGQRGGEGEREGEERGGRRGGRRRGGEEGWDWRGVEPFIWTQLAGQPFPYRNFYKLRKPWQRRCGVLTRTQPSTYVNFIYIHICYIPMAARSDFASTKTYFLYCPPYHKAVSILQLTALN